MVRVVVCKHSGLRVQHGSYHLPRSALLFSSVGRLRELCRRESRKTEHFVCTVCGSSWYSVLRTRRFERCYRNRRACRLVLWSKFQEAGQEHRKQPNPQHLIVEHACYDYRLFVIRSDSYPFVSQSAYGSELSRGYLHSWRVSWTRAVRFSPIVLRSGLYFAG